MISARVQEVLGGQLGFQSEPFALSARRCPQIILSCVSVPRLLYKVRSQGTDTDLLHVVYKVD